MHTGALQHRDIIGQWKRGLLEMGEGTLLEKRQMVAFFTRTKRKLDDQQQLLKQSKANG